MSEAQPSPGDRILRRIFLVTIASSAVVLVPWIVYLALTLRSLHRTDHWDLAWVGFDVVLLVALGLTALAALKRRRAVIPAAIVSATLLLTDAWFDVVLDWGDRSVYLSIAGAVLFEIPLAALLLFSAVHVVHRIMGELWAQSADPGAAPVVSQLQLPDLMRMAGTPPEYYGRSPSSRDAVTAPGPDPHLTPKDPGPSD